MKVFVDTSAWISLVAEREPHHEAVTKVPVPAYSRNVQGLDAVNSRWRWESAMKDHRVATCCLRDLPVGSRAIVSSITAQGLVRRRLLDLGLVPGTEVAALRKSPLGDPTAFAIRGATIALRSEDSATVAVHCR
ncbi:MAG: FeoA domain-containing protein [Chitinophagales bacterium]